MRFSTSGFFMNQFPPSPWIGSSYFPRSLCLMWFWFGLEITRRHCCHFTKLCIQSLETIPLKVEWMDFWKEIYQNLFFNIEFSQNQFSHLFLKHFHRNNSIYVQNHHPLLRSEGGNLQTDAAQLFLFDPIPAKAKKLGLLSIYKFSLLISLPNFLMHFKQFSIYIFQKETSKASLVNIN